MVYKNIISHIPLKRWDCQIPSSVSVSNDIVGLFVLFFSGWALIPDYPWIKMTCEIINHPRLWASVAS